MKSFKKIFLMLTSFAMVVGTLLVGGSVKKTETVEAAIQTDTIEMTGFGGETGGSYIATLTAGTSKNGLNVSASNYIPDSGQIRGSKTTNNQNFYLYNTDPTLGSIRSIVITEEGSGTFSAGMYISVGIESQASVTSTTGSGCTKGTVSSDKKSMSWSFDGTTDYTFFKLFSPTAKFTSGIVSGVVIKVEYDYTTNVTVTFDSNGGTCNTGSLISSDGSGVTLPIATKDNCSFGGWKTSDGKFVGNAGEQYTPTEDITLYAIWNDDTVVKAKEALDKINSYMSYGFKYDVTNLEHGQYLLQNADNTGLVGKSIVIVAGNSATNEYYAVKNDASETDESFGSVKVAFDGNNLLTSESYINNMGLISWKLEKGETAETYKISNGNKYISCPSKTKLKLVDKGDDFKIVKMDNNSYSISSINDTSRAVFYNSSSAEFKNYATSNLGDSGYYSEMYIYVVGKDVEENKIDTGLKTQSNVDIRLKCGIDDTAFANVTLPSGAKYGIAVSTDSKIVYYEIIANSKEINVVANPGNAEPNKYVIIKLGNDLLNNLEKVTTEFTTQAYLYVDGVYYLSSNTKTYSVASLTETAVNASVEGVSGLYNILKDMGCYKAA